jgi:predicted Zn finger-like uncharacterized protein
MIINCPNCNTKYNINSDLIDKNGRKVKCIKCQNIWLVTATITEASNHSSQGEEEANISESFNYIEKIPEVKGEPVKNISWLLSCVLIIISLVLLLIFFKERITNYYPPAQKFYDKLHYHNIKGLSLKNVQVNKLTAKGENFVIIHAAIKNDSTKDQIIPNLLVLLEDNNKKEQYKKLIKTNRIIKPNELYNFEEIIFLMDENSSQLTLDLVNDIQLFLR